MSGIELLEKSKSSAKKDVILYFRSKFFNTNVSLTKISELKTSINNYIIGKYIGEGERGKVFKCKRKKDNKTFAIKQPLKKEPELKLEDFKYCVGTTYLVLKNISF